MVPVEKFNANQGLTWAVPGSCTLTAYPPETTKAMNFAIATIYGRLPKDEGSYGVNEESTEGVTVLEGHGVLNILKEGKNESIALEPGTVVYIPPGTGFSWQATDPLKIVIACAPKFDPARHRIIQAT
jgi:mannose-6-phosphate isomerase-like protein (cupin superfamily)